MRDNFLANLRITPYHNTQMKKTQAFFICILLASLALGQTLVRTASGSASLTGVSGNYEDWSIKTYDTDDITVTIGFTDGTTTSSYDWQFRISGPTGLVKTIYNDDITASSTNVSFTIVGTNMVSAGSYSSELRGLNSSNTNQTQVAGRGRFVVLKSLE